MKAGPPLGAPAAAMVTTGPRVTTLDCTTLDRGRGALAGLAVADALGTTLEFQARDALPCHTEITGGGPFGLEPGVWTDDTSMALALADSLANRDGWDAADLMDRFLRWMEHGAYSPTGRCFDIGVTTRAALSRYRRTGDPVAGPTAENTAGNGSLMRLAPVVLRFLHDPAACRRIAGEQSRTTHGAPQAVQSCQYFADLLRRAILGETKDAVLTAVDWNGHPAVRAVAAGGWRGKDRWRRRYGPSAPRTASRVRSSGPSTSPTTPIRSAPSPANLPVHSTASAASPSVGSRGLPGGTAS